MTIEQLNQTLKIDLEEIRQYDKVIEPIIQTSSIVFNLNKIIGKYSESNEVLEQLIKLQIDAMQTVRLMLDMANMPLNIKVILEAFIESAMAGEI